MTDRTFAILLAIGFGLIIFAIYIVSVKNRLLTENKQMATALEESNQQAQSLWHENQKILEDNRNLRRHLNI